MDLMCPLILDEYKKYESSSDNFVQIINISRKHWVCVSNISSPSGTVNVYDSMPHISINNFSLKSQIAAILKTPDQEFQVRHIDVQRQNGINGCALFAMAFATSLCWHQDPWTKIYLQSSLRGHFMDCCKTNDISPFPSSNESRRGKQYKIIHSEAVNVFCVCRLPWNKNYTSRGSLAQCSVCKEWFQELCMKINKEIIRKPLLKYKCNVCLNK